MSAEEHDIIINTEMKPSIQAYLSTLITNPQNIHSLADIIAFTRTHPLEDFPARNVERLGRALAADDSDTMYQSAREKERYFTGEGGIDAALEKYQCDVLLVPKLSVALQSFAAAAGSPVVSVPMGWYGEGTGVVRGGSGLVDVAPGIPYVYHA